MNQTNSTPTRDRQRKNENVFISAIWFRVSDVAFAWPSTSSSTSFLYFYWQHYYVPAIIARYLIVCPFTFFSVRVSLFHSARKTFPFRRRRRACARASVLLRQPHCCRGCCSPFWLWLSLNLTAVFDDCCSLLQSLRFHRPFLLFIRLF